MKCVILGAGKIARGFLGHLLFLSNIPFIFVEKDRNIVNLINEKKEYTVNILGDSSKNCKVIGIEAICLEEEEKVIEAIKNTDLIFTAVGGKNLSSLASLLTKGIEKRLEAEGNLNIITCENWKQPALLLEESVRSLIDKTKEAELSRVGFSEAVIMRSGIEAGEELRKQDPLIVNVQDYWKLPINGAAIKGQLPPILGMELLQEFTGFLERKFYTYNAANGTTSYVGALLGYQYISEAAHDERILKILDGVYLETAKALSQKHKISLQEQLDFTLTSKRKLQDETIVDYIERNARDPLRKLGKDDRLVGSARMVMEQGIKPENLSLAIAAAIYYHSPGDEFAEELEKKRKTLGIDYILRNVCEIDPESELAFLIKEKIELLKKWGWIKE